MNPKPPLEPEYIWARAGKGFDPADESAGRDPADVADFRLRLEQLCASLRDEAELNALGHAMAYGQLRVAVRNRLALGRLWRNDPELPRTPIAPPIIVAGQMRSGTTRMHRLLAADPAHSATRLCDSIEPVPCRPDIRPLRSAAWLAMARKVNPWMDAMHPFGASRPDEELGWLSVALNPAALEAQYRIPSFVAFSEGRDPAPVYREFARILRTDAATRGNAHRPRVLKCPQYAEDLAALLDEFPDARVVRTSRDADDVLASSVSVVAGQMAYQSDDIALADIEDEWRRKIALREARMDEALAAFDGPLAEVEFDALGANWQVEIARVYDRLGLDLTEDALGHMRREQERAATGRHRAHSRTYRAFAEA